MGFLDRFWARRQSISGRTDHPILPEVERLDTLARVQAKRLDAITQAQTRASTELDLIRLQVELIRRELSRNGGPQGNNQ